MNPFSQPFPGLVDDPLTQIRDLPDQPFRIAPLRDPKPQRALTIPHPLEPNAGGNREGHNSTAKLSSRKNTSKSASTAEPSTREKVTKPTDISSIVEPVPKPTKIQLPSFVSLAAVEKKPLSLNNEDSRKRARLDFDDLLVSEPILLPKLSDIEKKQNPSYLPPTSVNALHEPPPNADLLPPIETETLPPRLLDTNTGRISEGENLLVIDPSKTPTEAEGSTQGSTNGTETVVKKSRRQVRKWTHEETEELMEGVRKHGIGKWKDILEDPKCTLGRYRTAIDLKDRFRVCCPESYKARPANNDVSEYRPRPDSPQEGLQIKGSEATRMKLADLLTQHMADPGPPILQEPPAKKTNNSRSERLCDDERVRLGINEAIERDQTNPSGRRRRRLWTREEDTNLMRGVEKYGFAWTTMQEDESLNLKHRKATDLRDRIRNKFPDGYKNAGFRPVRSKHIGMPSGTPQSETFSMNSDGPASDNKTGHNSIPTTPSATTDMTPKGPPSPPRILGRSSSQTQLAHADNSRTGTSSESIMAMDSLLTDQSDAQDLNPKTLTLPGFTMFRDDWDRDDTRDDGKGDGKNDGEFEWSTTLPPLEEYFPI